MSTVEKQAAADSDDARRVHYDIIVGIPSYNEADTLPFVVQQVDMGLRVHFPGKRALIVNVDGSPEPSTKKAFLATPTTTEKRYHKYQHPISGKGSAFFWLFSLVAELEPEAVVVVDADLKSITPDWMRLLLTPIMDGYDFVTPHYARHKYDGTVTNSLCYPLVYGIFGTALRQPIGGDFAFSSRLCNHWLAQQWSTTTRQYGIDIFMTLSAILGGYRICEVGLGSKVHKPSAPKLTQMFLQVAGTIFDTIIQHLPELESRPFMRVQHFGLPNLGVAQDLQLDPVTVLNTALVEFSEQEALIKKHLPAEYERLRAMRNEHLIRITIDDWIRLLFLLIARYAAVPAAERQEVLLALRALYFARVHTFIRETYNLSTAEAEPHIVALAERLRERRGELFSLFAHAITVGEQ